MGGAAVDTAAAAAGSVCGQVGAAGGLGGVAGRDRGGVGGRAGRRRRPRRRHPRKHRRGEPPPQPPLLITSLRPVTAVHVPSARARACLGPLRGTGTHRRSQARTRTCARAHTYTHAHARAQVHGGPWLLEQCGLRGCGCVAVECAKRSLTKAPPTPHHHHHHLPRIVRVVAPPGHAATCTDGPWWRQPRPYGPSLALFKSGRIRVGPCPSRAVSESSHIRVRPYLSQAVSKSAISELVISESGRGEAWGAGAGVRCGRPV